MKLRFLLLAFMFIIAAACNNDPSVQDGPDSSKIKDTSDHNNWPGPKDIMGGDTVPSPETHADTSRFN